MDVEEADLRVIVKLLGETAALPGGLMGKKLFVLDGLCDIAGSIEWVWALDSTQGTTNSFSLRRKIGDSFHRQMEQAGDPSTATKEEPFYELPPSHVICSTRTVNAMTQSKILLLRDANLPAYSKRECNLALLVLNEIPWLHWQEWKPLHPVRRNLSPRLRLTLDLLLVGLGRKEIADQIGISEGTVCGYIRKIYQKFGVNSQAELMRSRLQKPTHC